MSFRKIQTSNQETSNISFTDSIIILGKNNVGNTDVGFLGKIGVNTYSGLIRDADTSTFYIIDQYTQSEDNNVISANDITKGNLTLATLTADNIVSSSIPTLVSELTNDAGYITTAGEAQVLTLTGSTLAITNGSSVSLSAYATTTATMALDVTAKTQAIASANSYTNGQITTITGTLQSYARTPPTWVAPKGTEANRPTSPVEGQFYFNTDTKIFEGYNGTSWIQLVPSTLVITP
jgi:hypothetical protein